MTTSIEKAAKKQTTQSVMTGDQAPEGFKPMGELPSGFEIVSMAQLPDVWEPNDGDVIMGTVIQLKNVSITRGKNVIDTKFMIIEVGEMQSTVWESAALEDLFGQVEVGDQVHIKYVGLIPRPNQPQPMKGFECGIKRTQKAES